MFLYELIGCGVEFHCSHLSLDFAPVSSKEFLDIQATIECAFALKCVRDMIRTYSLKYCILNMNISKFQQFWGKLLSSLLQLLVSMTTFFLEIMILRYAFLEKQKYIERSNNIGVIALYFRIPAIFSSF